MWFANSCALARLDLIKDFNKLAAICNIDVNSLLFLSVVMWSFISPEDFNSLSVKQSILYL